MAAFTCLLLNIVLLMISYKRYYTMISPPFILNLMWGGSNLLNMILGWNSGELEYLILALPPLMFSLGFFLSTRRCSGQPAPLIKANEDLVFIEERIKILFVINVVTSCVYFIFVLRRFATYYNGNIWYTVRLINWLEADSNNTLFTYAMPLNLVLPSVFIFQYRRTHIKLWRVIISVSAALLWGFFYSSRTPIFTFIVVTLFSQILCGFSGGGRKLKRKTKRAIVFAGLFVVVMFVYIGTMKNGDIYGDVSLLSFAFKSIVNYTNLSSAAFVEWFKRGFTHSNGVQTFRFVLAVLARFGVDFSVPNNSGGLFINYNGYQTNAFTVACSYVADFGIVFMAFMLFFFGLVHGISYSHVFLNSGRKKIRHAIFCAALYVPLFYQILTNQYMNCLSQWIQYYLWSGFLISFTVVKTSEENVKNAVVMHSKS